MRVLGTVPLLVAGAVLLVLALAQEAPPPAFAAALLENGTFEAWEGDVPASWSASGTFTPVSSPSVSGLAAQVTGSGSLSQFVEATPGRDYAASVRVIAPAGAAQATLRVTFLDAGLLGVGLPVEMTVAAPAGFTPLELTVTAPAGAAYAGVQLLASPLAANSSLVFDNASLDDAPQPQPTPTFTATHTPTPANTAVPSATRTRTPLPASTPPTGGAVVPVLPGPTGRVFGEELLVNPEFEFALDGTPLAWEKFGGLVFADSSAGFGESGAAVFISQTDSTKWLHQVVTVTPGRWYRAQALARLGSGTAAFSVSLLWYPTFDGDGQSMDGLESDSAAATSGWTMADTGPVQAPPGARAARFRLMLRAPFPAAVVFDGASMVEVLPPAASTAPADGGGVSEPVSVPGLPDDQAPPSEALHLPPRGVPPAVVPLPPRTGTGPGLRLHCLVCLSEVLPDPLEAGRDAPYEWVELYNNGPDTIDVGGWSVGDVRSVDVIPAPAVLRPGAFLVVRSRAAATGGAMEATVADGEVGSGFNNDEDMVRLLGPDGEVVDSITYGSDAGGPAPPGAGRTLARDLETGEWRTGQRASPGGAPLVEPTTTAPLTVAQSFGAEAPADRTPWILLGVCVTIGVFSAPFALERLRRELRDKGGG